MHIHTVFGELKALQDAAGFKGQNYKTILVAVQGSRGNYEKLECNLKCQMQNYKYKKNPFMMVCFE